MTLAPDQAVERLTRVAFNIREMTWKTLGHAVLEVYEPGGKQRFGQDIEAILAWRLRSAEEVGVCEITMQDVRLAVGEGRLNPADVLAGCNAELRRRACHAAQIPDADGIAWFERTFGVPLGDMPGLADVERVRAGATTKEPLP